MIKWIKTAFLVILCVALLALIILWRLSAGNESSEKEEANASCDYFNGEVVEITDEYFILKPIAEWTWKETTRVKTPKTNVAQKIVALKTGDLVRVAFNSKAMEWKEDEVLIPVAFAFCLTCSRKPRPRVTRWFCAISTMISRMSLRLQGSSICLSLND